MFEDEKIRLIEALPEGDTLLVIWMKMLAHAGKTNDDGYIYLNERTPYTPQMLSIVYNRPQPVIDLAIKTFMDFGMIEVNSKGIYIANWEKHQNVEGLDKIRQQTKERVRKHRERKKVDALPEPTELEECNVTSNAKVTQSNALDIDKELEIDKKKEKEKKKAVASDVDDVWSHYLITFEGFFKRMTLTKERKTKIQERLKEFSVGEIKQAISNIRKSPYHVGQNDKGKFYADITFICRNDSKLEEWINYEPKQAHKQGENNGKEQRVYVADFGKSSEDARESITGNQVGWIGRNRKRSV